MVGGDEFGPDAPPVVGAQVAPRNGTFGQALDGGAVLDWHAAAWHSPLRNGAFRDAEQGSKLGLRPDALRRNFHWVQGTHDE